MLMTTLSGREPQLAVIDEALRQVLTGSGRLVLISGEAGIGKSRLVDSALARAGQQNLMSARGYAVDDSGAPPLWPWLRLVRDLPELAADLDASTSTGTGVDPAARFHMFVDVADRLRGLAAPSGLVLVLEDLHWADRTSVLLLRHLAADLSDNRMLIIATFREQLTGPLADNLPELLRGSQSRALRLTGLAPAAVRDWFGRTPDLAACAGVAELLVDRTNGNPLLLGLAAEALSGTGDVTADSVDRLLTDRPDLRALIAGRLAALSQRSSSVVTAASVIAEQIQPRMLAGLLAEPVAVVEVLLAEAVAAGVLRFGASGISFTHALVRDAVYQGLGGAARAELHGQVAGWLADSDRADLAGLIAGHWRRAGHPDRAGPWAVRAAVLAAARHAYDEAAAFAQIAFDCATEAHASVERRADLAVDLATARFAANHVAACLRMSVEAAELAEAAGRPDLLAQAALALHGIGSIDVYRVVRGLCERALRQLPADQLAVRARLLAQVATSSAEDEAGPTAERLSAEALTAAEASGDAQAILEAIAARHLSIAIPSTVFERRQLAIRAVELGSASRDPMAELWGHLWKAEADWQLGDLNAVDRELASIDQIAVTRKSPITRWHHERLLATKCLMVGDFAEALAHNELAHSLAAAMNDLSTTGMYFAFLQVVAVVRGDPDSLPPSMVEGLQNAPPMPLVRIAVPTLLALAGKRTEAVAAFEEFRGIPADFPVGTRWAPTLSTIGVVAVLLDDAEVAETVYQKLLPDAGYCTGDGSGLVAFFGSNACALGDLAVTAGRYDEALRLYADAMAVNLRLGARPFVALSRLGWAKASILRDPGRKADLTRTGKLLAEAAGEFRRLGMPGPLARATALQQQLIDPDTPLTPRETEVAGLVADALSNREIATRLFLSERTVESHVRSILNKLAFTSRTEIAGWFIRAGSADRG